MIRISSVAFFLLCHSFASQAFSQSPKESNPDRSESHALPFEGVDNATRAKWLLDGNVIDAKTGKPIERFLVTPGTRTIDDQGETQIRWRENLAKKMSDGLLRWPRTSGFSEMRFKVTADGYRPLVTHSVRRGGPHTRVRIRLMPVNLETNPTLRDEAAKRR